MQPAWFLAGQVLKVNRYTFKGSNSITYHLASPFNGGQPFKEIICSLGSKLFLLRVDLDLKKLCHPGKQTGSHKSCLPLKNGGVTIHLSCCKINPFSLIE